MDTTTQIKTQPLVTILMLTYNRAHFLPEAIRSVLGQTYENWELVVIDDGSTDTTAELMASYADLRIKYIQHKTNAGLFARRTESLNYVTGTYTAILDSDDFWTENTKLAEQVAFLEANPEHAVVGTQTALIDERGHNLGEHKVATIDSKIRSKILFQNQFVHSSILIRTKVLKKTAGYQPVLGEDLEIILQLGNFGKLANLPQVHTAHRVHPSSENDHGLKMISGVYSSIKKHGQGYPYTLLAILLMRIRLFVYSIK